MSKVSSSRHFERRNMRQYTYGPSGQYRYHLHNSGASSAKFGPCEVCGEHVSEVWFQSEEQKYERPDHTQGWTYYKCYDLVGHYECIVARQL